MTYLRKWWAAALVASMTGAVQAAEVVTLRVHHFLPASSTAHVKFIAPWCAKIQSDSGGQLKCQIYPSMQLGGTPPQLFDQVKDGVADIVWTLPGYQAGRFMVIEAFELPFMTAAESQKSSRALWHYATKNATNEFRGVRPLIFHVGEGAIFHTNSKPIRTLADFKGLKLRAPTRLASKLIGALGGVPVAMPVPQVGESLSKGVIDGALLPWEVLPSLKVHEIVKHHSELDAGVPNISNNVFVLAMNPAKYESLPADLKRVIDANSGADASAWVGKVWDEAREPARKLAVDRKNSFYKVPASELAEWQKAAEPVSTSWIKEVAEKGHDGNRLLQEARALLQQ